MTPELLRDAGFTLYGSRWKSDLARTLGRQYRTIHRWSIGEVPIPANTAESILLRLGARGEQVNMVMNQIRAILPVPEVPPEQ